MIIRLPAARPRPRTPDEARVIAAALAGALAALAPDLRDGPAITVGPRSREAAIRAGFRVVAEGQGDGNAALRLAAEQGYHQLLHPRGEDHVALDTVPGVKLLPMIVYRARAESALAAPARPRRWWSRTPAAPTSAASSPRSPACRRRPKACTARLC